MAKRYLEDRIRADLTKKMVFLGGPRQVGKTTFALHLLGGDETSPAYFNFDNDEDRERLLAKQWPQGPMVILDELHEFRRWRTWLKGIYDKSKKQRSYLVTGSARLDYYRRGGDSLVGRYHYFRLHPFSWSEIQTLGVGGTLADLMTLGGFPEPYLGRDPLEARRWRRARRSQVVRDDLRDLHRVSDITLIELLARRLPDLVGSPLSINALAQDLQVAHRTAANWLDILERLYYCYRIAPFGAPKIRAVKKERKMYLWDWAEIENEGARFENMIASHLLKYCHYLEDTEGHTMELRYLRDTDGREVDFVVLKNNQPLFAVECKLSAPAFTKAMHYFRDRTNIPCFYLVHLKEPEAFDSSDASLRSRPADAFLRTLV